MIFISANAKAGSILTNAKIKRKTPFQHTQNDAERFSEVVKVQQSFSFLDPTHYNSYIISKYARKYINIAENLDIEVTYIFSKNLVKVSL